MILITGANGQIGVDLVRILADRFGSRSLVATDIHEPTSSVPEGVIYETLDIRDREHLGRIVEEYGVDTIYHLAGILSANGERKPDLCWEVNVDGFRNVLNVSVPAGLRVFWPSSIAVFGPQTVRDQAPQAAVTDPDTMYGITKLAGERLCNYYSKHHGLDIRSIRFPGVVSHAAPPGGGTTDFAVDMFLAALNGEQYECFVAEDTVLPMMYMPDAIKSVLDLMDAPKEKILVRTSYNVTGFSFSAGDLANAIRGHIPGFNCDFKPDFRQKIADTWPRSIDDSAARADWGWNPDYDLNAMVRDMIEHLAKSQG